VFAGLPTTSTLIFLFETLSIIYPYYLNIFELSTSKSFLSIPFNLGFAPTNTAASAFRKASSASVVAMISSTKGNAQSYNSNTSPFRSFSAIGSSSN